MHVHPATGLRRPTMIGASLSAFVLVLAACSSASPSESAAAESSQGAEPSQVATSSEAGAAARCELTADASPSATITIAGSSFGDAVTISAGQAVAFTNSDSVGHTLTEGTGGQAASDACVDEPIEAGETEVVTFKEPGDYDITCKIHSTMQTVVHVQ